MFPVGAAGAVARGVLLPSAAATSSVQALGRVRYTAVDGPPSGEPFLGRVPELDALLAQPPAQQHVLVAPSAREVNKRQIQILHVAAQRPDALQALKQHHKKTTETNPQHNKDKTHTHETLVVQI